MRFTFLRILLFISLCWMSFPLQAQYVVQGVVTDSLTREPLPYTSVYLKGTTEGGMTDDKGQVFFQDLPPPKPCWLFLPLDIMNTPVLFIRHKVSVLPSPFRRQRMPLNEVVVKPKRERYKKKR